MIGEIQTKEKLFSDLELLEGQVEKLKDELKNTLNVNKKIKDIISLMRNVGKQKKAVIDLSEDENKMFEKRYSDCKEQFKKLKSLHIAKYNEKISQVNKKISPFRNKSIGSTFSDSVKEKIKTIPFLMPCSLLKNNNSWQDNTYLDTLEYDKIQIAELIVQQLESELNVKNDDLTNEMNSIAIEIDNVLKKMEQNIKGNLTIQDIDKYLFECGTLSGRIEILNIMNDKLKSKISQVDFAKFNGMIVNFRNRIGVDKGNLLAKKQEVSAKSIYDALKDGLEVLERDYTELVEMFFENETKFTKSLVADYKRRMKKFNTRFVKIKKCVDENFKEGRINVQQLSNLKEMFGTITSIHDELNEKLDNEPCILGDEKSFSDEYFATIESDLKKLKTTISNLGNVFFKDMTERRNIGKRINELGSSLNALETSILRFKRVDVEKYNALNAKYGGYKEKFDELNQSYNEKCPLLVRKVREAKPVYEKHKKLGLISAGLASISLVTSSYTLIPALMHGNAMLGSSVPAFSGMMSFFNKILGSLIGASIGKNGAWVLATGAVLNGAVATTSILKFLATIGAGAATLAAPLYIPQIVLMIKKLVDKIKEYDLKKKLSDTYQSGVKKVHETVKKIEEYDLKSYYKNLYAQYIYNNKVRGTSLDEFCKKQKLSSGDKQVLSAMIAKGKLEEEINKIVGEQVSSKRKVKTT